MTPKWEFRVVHSIFLYGSKMESVGIYWISFFFSNPKAVSIKHFVRTLSHAGCCCSCQWRWVLCNQQQLRGIQKPCGSQEDLVFFNISKIEPKNECKHSHWSEGESKIPKNELWGFWMTPKHDGRWEFQQKSCLEINQVFRSWEIQTFWKWFALNAGNFLIKTII